VEDFNAALASDLACVTARYHRGAIRWAWGKRQEAEANLVEAARLQPELRERIEALKAKGP
jgi:hypothetical protein